MKTVLPTSWSTPHSDRQGCKCAPRCREWERGFLVRQSGSSPGKRRPNNTESAGEPAPSPTPPREWALVANAVVICRGNLLPARVFDQARLFPAGRCTIQRFMRIYHYARQQSVGDWKLADLAEWPGRPLSPTTDRNCPPFPPPHPANCTWPGWPAARLVRLGGLPAAAPRPKRTDRIRQRSGVR